MMEDKTIEIVSPAGSRWQARIRLAWYPAALLSLAFVIAAAISHVQVAIEESADNWLAIDTLSGILSLASALLSLFLAYLLFRRRPDDRMASFLSLYLVLIAIISVWVQLPGSSILALSPRYGWTVVIPLVIYPATCLLFLLFPDGRFTPSWSRRIAVVALVSAPLMSFAFLLSFRSSASSLGTIAGSLLLITGISLSVLTQFYRYRHHASQEQRQQIKWVVYGLGIMLLLIIAEAASYLGAFSFAVAIPERAAEITGSVTSFLLSAILPVSLTIAVLRYRLYDIEILIKRTLVYGALTSAVVGLYIVSVGGMSLAFQSNTRLAGAILTVALVVTLFRPLRNRLQGMVDRLIPARDDSAVLRASISVIDSERARNKVKAENVAKPVRSKQGELVVRLPARIRPLLRNMWFIWAALLLLGIALNIPAQINAVSGTGQGNATASAFNLASILAQSISSLISLTLAGVLFFKRPNEGLALFLSYFLLVIGVVTSPIYSLGSFLPGYGAFIGGVIQPLIFGPFLVAFLATFPNGRLVPGWTQWLIVAAILYAPVGPFVFTAESFYAPNLIFVAGTLIWFALIFPGIYAQIYRYRHISTHEERQQAKWIVYGFTLGGVFIFFATLRTIALNSQSQGTAESVWSAVFGLGWILAYSLMPISLTIAVMRYRLYDIDIIIRRTLVYGIVTAALAAVYFGSVVIMQQISAAASGEQSPAAIVISTLLIAALFSRIRRRAQDFIDRRFYRSKYDAAQTLGRFARAARDETDLEALTYELVTVVHATLRPETVSVWLRDVSQDPEAPRRGGPLAAPTGEASLRRRPK